MKKNKRFMKSLNRSTQVTILSCASFIAMTVILLVFLSAFPITPSEKIMASIGRENILENNNPSGEDITAISAITTRKQSAVTTAVKSSVSTGRTTTKTFKIVITTGSGFMRNGRTPSDNTNTKTTVIFDDPPVPTPDPGYTYPIYTTPPENPEEPNISDIPPEYDPNNPSGDPPVTDTPPVTDVSVWTEPPIDIPPVTDVPVWTEPPVFIDPNPPVTPDPNEGGGNFNSDPITEW